ncbi:MAG: copper resistance CopC family protein [Solirubrobacteraceae bacterium]
MLLGATVVGMLVAWSALGIVSPAGAHNYLVSSTPAADSTITELPDRFSVTTNGPLLDAIGDGSGFALQVFDADGRYYGDGCVSVEGSSAYTDAALGEAGDYTLLWQVVSEDGHTISDRFGFRWEPADPGSISQGAPTAPDCGGTAVTPGETPAETREDAPLGDVLWIGGALLAVLIAGRTTVLILGRKRQ